ncbi:hypothetical protein BGZ61DRAFT_467519 [Ilyonectria robusta]|uniref:uncharacterized protein n=1 Tax=Ilyonectria robusta TaxID=1079257 RepID=UPI001E8DA20D|nr:uncharacterized protein BGZ61DRAFT_467519 [Ilyonectria robusta]KAH8654734.1 hypothetical protein BGZ61DRAFT_467519 [Ilyonectria robusta]
MDRRGPHARCRRGCRRGSLLKLQGLGRSDASFLRPRQCGGFAIACWRAVLTAGRRRMDGWCAGEGGGGGGASLVWLAGSRGRSRNSEAELDHLRRRWREIGSSQSNLSQSKAMIPGYYMYRMCGRVTVPSGYGWLSNEEHPHSAAAPLSLSLSGEGSKRAWAHGTSPWPPETANGRARYRGPLPPTLQCAEALECAGVKRGASLALACWGQRPGTAKIRECVFDTPFQRVLQKESSTKHTQHALQGLLPRKAAACTTPTIAAPARLSKAGKLLGCWAAGLLVRAA